MVSLFSFAYFGVLPVVFSLFQCIWVAGGRGYVVFVVASAIMANGGSAYSLPTMVIHPRRHAVHMSIWQPRPKHFGSEVLSYVRGLSVVHEYSKHEYKCIYIYMYQGSPRFCFLGTWYLVCNHIRYILRSTWYLSYVTTYRAPQNHG